MTNDDNNSGNQSQADNGSISAGRDASGNHIGNRYDFSDQRVQLIIGALIAAADPSPPPNADSKDLHDCPHCGRKWVSKMALFCPLCGYSIQFARLNRSRVDDLRWIAPPLALMCALYTALLVHDIGSLQASLALTPQGIFAQLMGISAFILTTTGAASWWFWWRDAARTQHEVKPAGS